MVNDIKSAARETHCERSYAYSYYAFLIFMHIFLNHAKIIHHLFEQQSCIYSRLV